jgi:hypothetical protein
MDFLQSPINQAFQGASGMASDLGLLSNGGNETAGDWDPVEAYFECITTCSLEDGECVTQCVERLRIDSEAHD